MNRDNNHPKVDVSPPGAFLLEQLEKIGMTQKELADRLGRPLKTINEIIKGKSPISVSTALQLENIFPFNFIKWLELEGKYRQELAKIEEREQLKNDVEWAENFPIKKMIEYGWIQITTKASKVEKVKSLLKFFGVASVQQWKYVYEREINSSSFRISSTISKTVAAITAWLRKGELDVMNIGIDKEFSKSKFKNVLPEIKLLSYQQPDNFDTKLKSICEKVGVAVIYTPRLPKAPINGAARWVYNTPVIQMTDYGKANDRFWFTFFHEAGHIILHGKKDKEKIYDIKDEEFEVDNFANKWLVNEDVFNEIISFEEGITKESIEYFSEKYKLHPGIIVGHLQHKNIIDFSQFNGLKSRIDLF